MAYDLCADHDELLEHRRQRLLLDDVGYGLGRQWVIFPPSRKGASGSSAGGRTDENGRKADHRSAPVVRHGRDRRTIILDSPFSRVYVHVMFYSGDGKGVSWDQGWALGAANVGGMSARRSFGEDWLHEKCLLLFRQFHPLNQGTMRNSCLLLSTDPEEQF